ncbi:MAG: DNA polymerase IV [Saprospiraceae bacterium]
MLRENKRKGFERAILHLDLDAFFASVECRRTPTLRNRPLIIGGSSKRGVVASCSYEARRFGVQSAMPIKMALRLCPDAIVLNGDMEAYSKASKLVTEVIADAVPLFEKASIDEFYADLSGMDRHLGCWKWSQELRQKIIKESGLPISMGLSINKLVSKVSTGESKPNGAGLIDTGQEKAFLAPLSVKKIPAIGQKTSRKLQLMGVRTVQTLSEIPPKLLVREFGKTGYQLWQKANAIDDSPVVPHIERKSISTERTFQVDTIDIRSMKGILTSMIGRLAYDLRQQKKLTANLTVKIRYTDFNTYTKQKRIAHTANEQALLQQALLLFDQLYHRRQLVRLIGVRFGKLVHGHTQMNLFEDRAKEDHLQSAMDRVRRRFGAQFIDRASTK